MQRRPVATGFVPFEVSRGAARRDREVYRLAAGIPRLKDRGELFPAYSSLVENLISRKVKRTKGSLRTIALASGSRFHVDAEDRFAALLCYNYLQEASDLNVFCRLVSPGACVVDVGANFGLYAVEASRIAGADGKVCAFEPVPHQFALLEKNIVMNELSAIVEARPEAVAARTGEQQFFVTQSGSFSGLTDTGRSPVVETLNVSCVSLDDAASLKDTPVDLLKIDVEGAELEVLKGAAELIARSQEIVIQFEASYKNQTPASQREFVQWLLRQAELGFVLRTGFNDSEPGQVLKTADAIGRGMTGNLFLVRGGSSAESRLEAAFQAELKALEEANERLPNESDLLDIVIPLYRSEIGQNQGYERELAALTAEAQERETEFDAARLAAAAKEEERRQEITRLDDAHRASKERASARVLELETSRWWRLGSRFVLPILNVLKRLR